MTITTAPETIGTSPSYKWWLVAFLWLICFLNYADRQAIFSVFPLLETEFHLSKVQLGIIGSAFMWIYALSGPLAGFAGDRFSRKTLVLAGLIFWSLITIATALCRSYSQLVLCRALEGFGEAFYFPASMSLISAAHDSRTRSRAMAIHQSSVYAGTIAGGAVTGVLAQNFGWHSAFYLFGSVGALLGLVLMRIIREPDRSSVSDQAIGRRGVIRAIRSVYAARFPIILTAVFIGANFVAMVFLTWMPSFLYQKFGMTLAMAGLNGTAYLQIASVLGVLTGGLLADRLVLSNRAGRMYTQVIGLLCGVPFLLMIGSAVKVPVLIIGLSGFGFCKGIYDANIWASLHDVVAPGLRGTAVGCMNSIGWLGGGIAPVAIGAATGSFGMSACLGATSLLYLMVGLLLLTGARAFAKGENTSKAYV